MEGLGVSELKKIREKKGQSLLTFPDKYVLLDIETTGLSPKYDEIIEISAIRVEHGEIVDEFSELVKPKEEISSFITRLTGITNEMVESSRDIKNVLGSFKEFLKNEDIISGYNINFDINFLYDNFQDNLNHYFDNDFVDVMRLARNAFKNEVESFKLKKLAKHFKLSTEGMHRGIKDCRVTLEIFHLAKEKILGEHENLEKFLEWKKKNSYLKPNSICSTTRTFDIEHPCYDKEFVFTGTLKMVRKDAMQLVVNLGGKVRDRIALDTNYLVMGVMDYTQNIAGDKSSKIIKAENMQLKGKDIQIISEDVFYDMFYDLAEIMPEIKFEKNDYNKAKAFIMLLGINNSPSEIDKAFKMNESHLNGHTMALREILKMFSKEEKQKMFFECINEGFLYLDSVEKTKFNYLEKLKVTELKEILESKGIDSLEKTKKPLIEKIVNHIALEEFNLEQCYSLTEEGKEFREICG